MFVFPLSRNKFFFDSKPFQDSVIICHEIKNIYDIIL